MPEYTHMDISLAAEMIVNAHKSPSGEFRGFIIEGKLRTGKTVYSIKCMRDVFMALDPTLTMDAAYEMALQQVNFDIGVFLERIRDKQREMREMLPKLDWTQRIPVIVLDDASLYAGTDLYFKDQSMYSAFQDSMTTVGSAASSVIITAPHHLALTKCLREYYSYNIVKITKMDDWRREAVIQEFYETRTRTLKLRQVGVDEFTAHVPNRFYAKYLAPRLERGEGAVKGALAVSKERAGTKPKPIEIREVAEEVLKPKVSGHKKWKIKKQRRPRTKTSIVDDIAQRANMSREEYIEMLGKKRAEIADT